MLSDNAISSKSSTHASCVLLSDREREFPEPRAVKVSVSTVLTGPN